MKPRTYMAAIVAIGVTTAAWPLAAEAADHRPAMKVKAEQSYLRFQETRASKIIGSTAYNFADEDLGTIDDLIIKSDGKTIHAILSVGGFLGIGDKLVAVPYSKLVLRDNDRIYLDQTKEQLNSAPAVKMSGDGVLATGAVNARMDKHDSNNRNSSDREAFEREWRQKIDEWEARIADFQESASNKTEKATRDAKMKLEQAWKSVEAAWADMQRSTDQTWQKSKTRLERAWDDLEKEWQEATR